MSGTELLVVLVVVVLVVGAAVLAAAETALTHLDQARAAALEETDDNGDKEAAGHSSPVNSFSIIRNLVSSPLRWRRSNSSSVMCQPRAR